VFAETRQSLSARFVLLGLAIAVASLVIAGCGGDESTSSSSEAGSTGGDQTGASVKAPGGLVRDGQLTVCTSADYPPLESIDQSGEYVGYEIDLARATAERMGLEANFQNMNFNGLLPALDSGRCDVAWSGLYVDPERTKTFSTVPYQDSVSVIMVKAGNPADIHSPEDLAGKVVASQNGTNTLKLAEDVSAKNEANGLEPSNVQGYDKFEQAIQQLAVGRADAVITTDLDVAAREAEQPGTFEVGYSFGDATPFGVYYKPDNPELGDSIYEALTQLEDDGELEPIAEANHMLPEGIDIKKPIVATQG
jgi:polar amino acid transport system substrate-binding protein